MTDNEIIKALECCNSIDSKHCKGCPLFTNTLCNVTLRHKSLDLIKRQQAENEKLKNIEGLATKTIEKQDAEIERLEAEIEEANEADRQAELQALSESKDNAKLFCEAINHTKSEAIKEFERKIKAHAYYIGTPKEHRVVDEDDIDAVLKEMIEKNNSKE